MNDQQTPRHYSSRKSPKQRRSQMTVDAIKQAALEMCDEHGFQSIGTHDIADRAGISVGSLYQYFPNKESIFLTLYEETTAALVEEIKAEVPRILDAPLPLAVRATANHLLNLYVKHKMVLLDLKAQMPELNLDNSPLSFHSMIHGTLRIFISHRSNRASALEIETKAYFIEHIMLGPIQHYVHKPPARLSEKAFLDHLTTIVLAYLRTNPRRRRTPPSPAIEK